jgi:hypothetical protein
MLKSNLLSLKENCLLNVDVNNEVLSISPSRKKYTPLSDEININDEAENVKLLSISPSRKKYLLSRPEFPECLSVIKFDDTFKVTDISSDNLYTFHGGNIDYIVHDDATILDVSWFNNEKIIVLFVRIISHHELGFYILKTDKNEKEYYKYEDDD